MLKCNKVLSKKKKENRVYKVNGFGVRREVSALLNRMHKTLKKINRKTILTRRRLKRKYKPD